MAKNSSRKKIGLVFSYDEGWIAGSYYILNLIHSLNSLSDEAKPILHIFANRKEDFNLIKAINYPYCKYSTIYHEYDVHHYTKFEHIVNRVAFRLFKKLIFDKRPKSKDLDVCFPYIGGFYFENLAYIFAKIKSQQRLYWIPDFQEKYLSNFFTESELEFRDKHNKFIAYQNSNHIIFSSQDAKKDFDTFFPNHQAKTHVLPFAVTHPDYDHLFFDEITEKYNISQKFFFSPNQFWVHKNHFVILEAIKILKDKGINYQVVFSGRMQDYRNLDHSNKLLNFVKEHELEENIVFLGFIDRAEQLKLMKNSLAVIQPSLFEGWSTVVEDAKAMQQFVILSNLKVHKEQMKENVLFFNPHDAKDLAHQLQYYQDNYHNIERKVYDYTVNIRDFGKKFMDIVNQM